jgi:FSR family fosmidomycin resistance protein-like MFS transporter
MKTTNLAICLTVYGTLHALVDAACITLVLGGIDVKAGLLTYLLLYNILAFGLQLPFGWITDRVHNPVFMAVMGCILVVLSLKFFMHPLAAIFLAGMGNALFHVGGGTVSLNLRPGKAAMPGIFVAPGGIGLFVGGLILKSMGFHPELFVLPLLVMGLITILIKIPPLMYETKKTGSVNFLVLTILLLLITICIRSAVGLSVSFPWKSGLAPAILLAIGVTLGKGLGGFLSDAFGWIRITVGGLVVSALLLSIGPQIPAVGITGMFLFNMTMPVTLVAISNLLPGRPGFSFGLTTMALLAGALPTFFSVKKILSAPSVVLPLILVSALLLYVGLRRYYRKQA